MSELSGWRKAQISLVAGIVLFAVYSATTVFDLITDSPVFIPLPSADTAPAALLPISLLRDGDLVLDEYAQFFAQRWGEGFYFLRTAQGHWVSHYPVVIAILAVPIYAVPFWLGWLDNPENAFYAARFAAALLTAGAMVLFLLTCLERLAPRHALPLTFAFALGTSAWTTASQGLWQHTASLPLICGALWLLVRGEKDARCVPWAGVLLSAATTARYNNVTTFGVLGIYVLVRHRRQFLPFAALSLIPLVALLAYNQLIFGSPFEISYGTAATSGWTEIGWRGLTGLLISPAKGWFVFSPFLILGLIGSIRALRQPRALLFYTMLACWVFILVMSHWWSWYGGWSYGNRMLTDILPLWGLLMLNECLHLSRKGWLFFDVSMLFAVGAQMLGLFDYGVNWHHTYDTGTNSEMWLWDIKHSPILFYAYHYFHRLIDGMIF